MPIHRRLRFKPAEIALFALPLVVLVAVLAVFRLRPTLDRLTPTAANPKARPISYVKISLSPDGKVLATGDSQGFLKLWDSRDGKLLATLRQAGMWVSDLAFSPDGKYLAASVGKSLLIYNATSKRLLQTLVAGKLTYYKLAWAPDSQAISVATTTGKMYRAPVTVSVWQVQTGKKLAELDGKFTYVAGLSFSPDGRSLAVSGGGRRNQGNKPGYENFLQRWDLKTRQITYEQDLPLLESDVQWTPNGKQLILIGEIRNARTGKSELRLKGSNESSTDIQQTALSADGTILAGSDSRRRLIFWDLKTGQSMEWSRAKRKENFSDYQPGEEPVYEFEMKPDATRIANSGSNAVVYLWEIYRDGGRRLITDPWQIPQPLRLWKLNVETGVTEEIPAGVREDFFFLREPVFGSKQSPY